MSLYARPEDIAPCENQLFAESEMLLRIVKAHHLDSDFGTLTTRVFLPSSKDDGKLSHFLDSKTSAQNIYNTLHNHNIKDLVGIWGLTISEIGKLGLRAIDDSGCEMDPFNLGSHCYIDLRGLSLSKLDQKKMRADLLEASQTRGRIAPN